MPVKIIQKVATPEAKVEKPVPEGELLTPSQTYRFTNLSRSFYIDLERKGLAPAAVVIYETPKKYKVRRYRKSDLKAWMDNLPTLKPQAAA